MSSHSFGKGSNSRTNSYSPPDWAIPIYKQIADNMRDLYNKGEGGNSYNGKRVSDLSDNTKNVIMGLNNTANKFNNSYFNNLINQDTNSADNLSELASGKLIGNNKAFNQSLNNTLNNVSDVINRQMSGSGRYGSGSNNSVLADKLGQISESANAQQYNQDINNMMKANSLIDGSKSQKLSAIANYLSDQGNAYRNALGGNQIIDKNNQDKLNAQRQNWLDNDNQNWRKLKMLQDMLNGTTNKFGVQHSVSNNTPNSFGSLGGFFSKLLSK